MNRVTEPINQPENSPMAQYMLLLNHEPDRYDGIPHDEMMNIIKDYVAWVEQQVAAGIYLGGEKLSLDAGKTLSSANGTVEVHDSPFAELPEVLGGYMVIEAEDYDAAVEIARQHPHLVHNTNLHIRRLEKVD